MTTISDITQAVLAETTVGPFGKRHVGSLHCFARERFLDADEASIEAALREVEPDGAARYFAAIAKEASFERHRFGYGNCVCIVGKRGQNDSLPHCTAGDYMLIEDAAGWYALSVRRDSFYVEQIWIEDGLQTRRWANSADAVEQLLAEARARLSAPRAD